MQKNTDKIFLKKLIKIFVILMLLPAIVVVVLDPFYHYHAPLPGLKAVLNDKEYQCVGTLDHFSYDSLLVGSSVAENFNNRWFEQAYDIKLLKAIRAAGSTADLVYYVNRAYKNQNLKYIFYSLDLSALYSQVETSFVRTGQPMYLYNQNPFDDVIYLWNKDVLFKKIPLEIANSFRESYDEGMSYNWAQWKTFGREKAMTAYTPQEFPEEDRGAFADEELLVKNVDMIEAVVAAHPETEFVFYFPPYSLLWWDEAYRSGNLERNLYGREYVVKKLLNYSNVKFYDFQGEEATICNLDYYMDTLHFSPEITKDIFDKIKEEYLLKNDEITEEATRVSLTTLEIKQNKIKNIVEKIEASILWDYYQH